jgi:hypothetical protein
MGKIGGQGCGAPVGNLGGACVQLDAKRNVGTSTPCRGDINYEQYAREVTRGEEQ